MASEAHRQRKAKSARGKLEGSLRRTLDAMARSRAVSPDMIRENVTTEGLDGHHISADVKDDKARQGRKRQDETRPDEARQNTARCSRGTLSVLPRRTPERTESVLPITVASSTERVE